MGAPVTFTDGTTTGVLTKDVTPAFSMKTIKVTIPSSFVWGTDSLVINLKNYGASNISGFLAFEESTTGSIVIAATGTTSVSSGTLTLVTTGSTGATKVGSVIIFAY